VLKKGITNAGVESILVTDEDEKRKESAKEREGSV